MSNQLEEPTKDWLPGAQVTPELYAQWRSARRCDSHAAIMNNPVWDWLIRTRISAYTANRHFGGPDSCLAGPAWCFDRFGQSRTVLPDGRTILVAGEHEDAYDPDFYIYNDVVVWHPDDRIDVYGYPVADFPPTDFHSATLFGDRLILVGSLGYHDNRRPGQTQTLALDVHSLQIEPLTTTGQNPGWIFRHRAVLEGERLVICGGEVQTDSGIVENIDDWQLDLRSWKWTRLTDRQWPRFQFVRTDGRLTNLWQLRHEQQMREFKLTPVLPLPVQPAPELLDQLYRPDVAHTVIPPVPGNLDELHVFRIQIDGIVVRYVEDPHAVTLTVEGQLPAATLERLVADLEDKLTRLEDAPFLVRRW